VKGVGPSRGGGQSSKREGGTDLLFRDTKEIKWEKSVESALEKKEGGASQDALGRNLAKEGNP